VEDQQDLGNVIKQYLEIVDFEVQWCIDGESAYQTYQSTPTPFDLLILDIQLPRMSGFDLAEKITKENDYIPFLFLTARNEKKDRLYGLKIGADDYISKPFDIDELVLRIRNIIWRNHPTGIMQTSNADLVAGDITLNKDLLRISIGNKKQIQLTLREVELLEYLFHHQNHMLKREDILLQIWGENDYFLGRSLDVFISRLRKLLVYSKLVSIDNVYGIGFIFNVKCKKRTK
jgi:DNA-binding response OmpR family regulator